MTSIANVDHEETNIANRIDDIPMIPYEELRFGDMLGSGTFATVFKG